MQTQHLALTLPQTFHPPPTKCDEARVVGWCRGARALHGDIAAPCCTMALMQRVVAFSSATSAPRALVARPAAAEPRRASVRTNVFAAGKKSGVLGLARDAQWKLLLAPCFHHCWCFCLLCELGNHGDCMRPS